MDGCGKTSIRIQASPLGALDKLVKDGKAWIFDKEAFDTLNPGTGLPYGYKLKQKEHEYTIAKEAV